MPVMAALSATHSLVPPHPAPSAAAQLLGADLGRAILYGVAVSIPMAILGGIVYGGWISKRLFIPVPAMAGPAEAVVMVGAEPVVTVAAGPASATGTAPVRDNVPPRVGVVALVLVLPVLMIFTATVADTMQIPGKPLFTFFGHPFTALMVTALAAMLVFGASRGLNRSQISRMTTESLAPVGTLLLIMGGGGAFKQVIVDSGVGPYAGKLLATSQISLLVVAYLMSTAMRVAQGSATVAIITAAGIIAPLAKSVPGYRPEMILLAVCCGGTILSHVNDAGFWLVNEYCGMAVPQTLKSWTAMKVMMSLFGFLLVLAAQAVFG
jgi:H+/gluconate symporter-like permease